MVVGVSVIIVIVMVFLYFYNSSPEGFEDASRPVFTLYYAEWCPHCKTVKPLYKNWMQKNNGTLTVNGKNIKLTIVEEKEKDASDKAPVRGYPTFILNNGGKYSECKGSRDPSGWESWLSSNV